jgi:hypothetical protein
MGATRNLSKGAENLVTKLNLGVLRMFTWFALEMYGKRVNYLINYYTE